MAKSGKRANQAVAAEVSNSSSAPPVQLMDMVENFLSQHSFDGAHSAFKKQRKTKGWDASGSKLAKTADGTSLIDVYQRWEEKKDTQKSVESKSPPERGGDVDMKEATTDDSSSSSSGSSSSGSDSESEEETTTTVTEKKAPRGSSLKRKAPIESDSSSTDSSEASSESESDSDSESEDEPRAKKPKLSSQAQDRSEDGSDSESDSSSSEESESDDDSVMDVDGKSSESSDSSSSEDSDSDSDPDSDSSSDSSSDSGDDASEAAKVPLPASDGSASSTDTSSDSESESDKKPAKKFHKVKKDSSDSSVTLENASPVLKATSNMPPLPPDPVKGSWKPSSKQNVPFSRISKDIQVDAKFASNAYIPMDYSQRAHEDLIVTKGKGFTKEKNKKKKGSYRGGMIDIGAMKGVYFDD